MGEKYGSADGRGDLVILAFPSREFGSQEYPTDEEIAKFANGKSFPGLLMKLGSVKGSTAPEVWQFLTKETGSDDPTWNFNRKYLVSKSGVVSVPKSVEKDIEAFMEE